MKKEQSIRTLLGLQQKDIALLLGVSRAHWGMYEIGKRDLPLPAKQLLAEMLAHLQSTKTIDKNTLAAQQEAKQQELERLLRENEYQQLRLAKKMAQSEKKQATQKRLSLLADFLNNREAKEEKPGNCRHQSILRKAQQSFLADQASLLIQQELQIEILQHERKLIESKMRTKDS